MALKESRWTWNAAVLALACTLCGCSVTKFAANRAGDVLSGSGTAFSSDDDPELVKAAVPFSLKLMESVLQKTPQHHDLLLAASSGFTQYAYAFVEQEADEVAVDDFGASRPKYERAKRLYLRARDYGLRGLETRAPGLRHELVTHPAAAVQKIGVQDVPLLYWTAAAWGKAIGLSKDDPELLADLPIVEALIDRALALDEKFDRGAIHSFLISYEMARARATGEARDRSKKHFERAVALSEGRSAGPYVAYAEAACVPAQDHAAFDSALKKALAINPDAHPGERLMNLVMQKRARWLLSRANELFLEPGTPVSDEKTIEPAK